VSEPLPRTNQTQITVFGATRFKDHRASGRPGTKYKPQTAVIVKNWRPVRLFQSILLQEQEHKVNKKRLHHHFGAIGIQKAIQFSLGNRKSSVSWLIETFD
jgi:hypothetical protein